MRVPRVLLRSAPLVAAAGLAAVACLRAATLEETWKTFQQAVAAGDRQKVAGMTVFPFSQPSTSVKRSGKLSRDEFLAAYERIFTEGIRRQVALGRPRAVTQEDIDEARDDDLDPCGGLGDFIVALPPEAIRENAPDDEIFLRLVFRRVGDRYLLDRIIGCN
ncbi:MAG TPA: hypothetical protein VIB08_05475 [Thermoanaerobaculia bacterium]|jgi:hypothetical protein